jgi:hypothetical protein
MNPHPDSKTSLETTVMFKFIADRIVTKHFENEKKHNAASLAPQKLADATVAEMPHLINNPNSIFYIAK